MTPTPPQRTVLAVLIGLSVSHLLNDMLQALLPSLYPLLKDTYALSFWQIGTITLTNQTTSSLLQPLVATVPLQVFACEMATAKGHDVDQPLGLVAAGGQRRRERGPGGGGEVGHLLALRADLVRQPWRCCCRWLFPPRARWRLDVAHGSRGEPSSQMPSSRPLRSSPTAKAGTITTTPSSTRPVMA